MPTVVPAYGRDYTSKAKAIADWEAGKDFILQDISSPWDGKPINKEDAKNAGFRTVNIRYKKLRQIAVVKVAMTKVATPQDLQAEIRKIIAYSEGDKPSRKVLAHSLRQLANRLSAKTAADKDWSDQDPRAPKTPWGPAQYAYVLQRGLTFFGTASHGGLRVASGVARKALSAAALRQAESWGGAYWFEEDVAILIPLYERPEWYALFRRKMGGGGVMTPEQIQKSIERSFPRYFKMVEEGVKHPEPGDRLLVKSVIPFRDGRAIESGTELTLVREQRGKLLVEAPDGYQFLLPTSFISTGGVDWL
jgi:hypothetical protein